MMLLDAVMKIFTAYFWPLCIWINTDVTQTYCLPLY